MPERLSLFATTARGTEDLLGDELAELGASRVRQDRGGVRFSANLREALRICFWTRIAMRVLYPVGEFDAAGAEGLYEAASTVPWEDHLSTQSTFAVEATLKDSEHNHSGFVALKVKDAIVDRLRKKYGQRPDVDTRHPAVRVVVHLFRQKLSLALDMAGEPLYRRGYRRSPTAAPLKETLAAAILRDSKYTGEEPLLDPMCGSGTLVLEAGLIATRRPPSPFRQMSIERWPSLGAEASEIMDELRKEASEQARPPPCPLFGLDKDADALAAAKANAAAADLSKYVRLLPGDAIVPIAVDIASVPGLLVTNPPYGERLKAGGQKGMKSFYFKLGENLSELKGWRMSILAGNPAFESAFHLRPKSRRALSNGPIDCQLLSYQL
jgi:23S rRNA (guanine2445-N2)-methyltransferase / 23S rRNA (guanine2069-N7)-methyltransferase